MKNKIGSTLVVGAGISGIRSALDLAEMGYHVTLIDKAPSLGGTLKQLDYQFPTDRCGMCKMLPLVERDSASQYCLRKGLFHENIDILLSTELKAMEGEPGKFVVTLSQEPDLVDPERCMGCGECSRVCPVEAPDEVNAGLTMRKAIYLPVPHNIPNHFIVDAAACTRCGQCQTACPTGAIDLRLEARRTFRVLVVDDELIVRHSTKEWLEDEGFSTDMAESGPEALDKLAHQPFNMLLLDVKMPGMDGVEVLKRAKEMLPDLPVVMMTAYATVETAVEAMKFGAKDYLMKPFDPEALVAQVIQLYQGLEPVSERQMEVGAVILSAGFSSYDPATGINTYGYGELPNVVTSIEFERLVSGTGPNQGRLLRPGDSQPVRKAAWLQCVGSRNIQEGADYCSSVCCMFSIKEALLAKERSGGAADTAIFYMDMRTFGKNFQQYREKAEKEAGVRFVRSRVHSVEPEGEGGDLRLVYTDTNGEMHDEVFDLVVLAAGQRPSAGTGALAEMTGMELNPWGFCRAASFSQSRTSREGVLVGGSFSGLKDISESIIQAGSASLGASRLIHSKGGGLAEVADAGPSFRDVSREPPQVAVALCTCSGAVERAADLKTLGERLKESGSASQVIEIERLCTMEGWSALRERLKEGRANRVLIGACQPYLYSRKVKELGGSIALQPSLMDVVDIRTPTWTGAEGNGAGIRRSVHGIVSMGIARLKGADLCLPSSTEIVQKALVVGGGIAGMTAALAIADHGFEVSLVEQADELGGSLRTLYRTLGGEAPQELLQKTVAGVEKHPQIRVFKKARVVHSEGRLGHFLTTIENSDGTGEIIEHGATILATGGREAGTQSYGHGRSEAVLTQHELEEKLHDGSVSPASLNVVVMIQCVDSREEGRSYCSRICCSSALKNALHLKELSPDLDVFILYRDMMAYGFLEAHYTRARQAGVIFVQYRPEAKPEVSVENGRTKVKVQDPILGRQLIITPDLLVLSTGIVPSDHGRLADIFGIATDEDGFLHEAESKWRPVDFLKEGTFLCGLAHSPRSITESIATAEAAAQRALSIVGRRKLTASGIVAEVRHSLCSLCEKCIEACPYGARRKDEDEEKILVNDLVCQGCGSCAAVCPNSASVLRSYRDQQIFAVLDAALETASILDQGDIDR